MKSPSKKKKASARSWWKFWSWQLWRSPWFYIPTGIVLILLIALGAIGYVHGQKIYAAAMGVKVEAETLKQAAKDQNLAQLNDGLPVMQTKLDALQKEVQFFAFTKSLPWFGAYYADSEHAFAAAREGIAGGEVFTKALLPYADVLGLKGKAETGPTKTTQDRIAELVLLAPTILPAIDEANGHFAKVVQDINAIDSSRYPESFRGVQVRQLIVQSKDGISLLQQGMQNAKPLIQILPPALGLEKPKKYLILFQNDKELRPSGGFLTSVAYVNFDHGKFSVSDTMDIYHLDNNQQYMQGPWPVLKYLGLTKWLLRDTNFSPDFSQSMKDFEYYYTKEGRAPIDGIIAVDTQFVGGLMDLTGPIQVSGYKEPFSTKLVKEEGVQVPQVVYQLEYLSEMTGGGANRKGILGDLMNAIIKKALSEPPNRWPDYIKTAMKEGQEKHVLLSLHNQDAQQLAAKWNFTGEIKETSATEDYLHINDANFGGRKSNFFLTQQVSQDITVAADGTVKEKVTINYHNTAAFNWWLNPKSLEYVRVYVPLGSKLLRHSGGDQPVHVTEDLGKTVFDNHVGILPLGKQTLTFEYQLPFKVKDQYKGLIQKQAGTQNWQYTVSVNNKSQSVVLDGDKEIQQKL